MRNLLSILFLLSFLLIAGCRDNDAVNDRRKQMLDMVKNDSTRQSLENVSRVLEEDAKDEVKKIIEEESQPKPGVRPNETPAERRRRIIMERSNNSSSSSQTTAGPQTQTRNTTVEIRKNFWVYMDPNTGKSYNFEGFVAFVLQMIKQDLITSKELKNVAGFLKDSERFNALFDVDKAPQTNPRWAMTVMNEVKKRGSWIAAGYEFNLEALDTSFGKSVQTGEEYDYLMKRNKK